MYLRETKDHASNGDSSPLNGTAKNHKNPNIFQSTWSEGKAWERFGFLWFFVGCMWFLMVGHHPSAGFELKDSGKQICVSHAQ